MKSLFLRCSDFTEATYGEQVSKIWSHRGNMHLVNDRDLLLHLSAADHMGPYTEGAWGLSVKECETWAPFLIREIQTGNVLRDGLKKACQNAGMSEELLHKVFYGWGGLIREKKLQFIRVLRLPAEDGVDEIYEQMAYTIQKQIENHLNSWDWS